MDLLKTLTLRVFCQKKTTTPETRNPRIGQERTFLSGTESTIFSIRKTFKQSAKETTTTTPDVKAGQSNLPMLVDSHHNYQSYHHLGIGILLNILEKDNFVLCHPLGGEKLQLLKLSKQQRTIRLYTMCLVKDSIR